RSPLKRTCATRVAGGSEERDQQLGRGGDGEPHRHDPPAGVGEHGHAARGRQRHLLQRHMADAIPQAGHQEGQVPHPRRRRRRRRRLHAQRRRPVRRRVRRVQGAQDAVQHACLPYAHATAVLVVCLPPRQAQRAVDPRRQDGGRRRRGLPPGAHAGEARQGRRVQDPQVQALLRRQHQDRAPGCRGQGRVRSGSGRPVRRAGGGQLRRSAAVRVGRPAWGSDRGERGGHGGGGGHGGYYEREGEAAISGAGAGGLRRRPSVRLLCSGGVVGCGALRRPRR
ncbi:Os11g0230700, partial [Oryza sativa Japonica Group]